MRSECGWAKNEERHHDAESSLKISPKGEERRAEFGQSICKYQRRIIKTARRFFVHGWKKQKKFLMRGEKGGRKGKAALFLAKEKDLICLANSLELDRSYKMQKFKLKIPIEKHIFV